MKLNHFMPFQPDSYYLNLYPAFSLAFSTSKVLDYSLDKRENLFQTRTSNSRDLCSPMETTTRNMTFTAALHV